MNANDLFTIDFQTVPVLSGKLACLPPEHEGEDIVLKSWLYKPQPQREGMAVNVAHNPFLASGKKKAGDWVNQKVIGTGGFGSVTLWKNEVTDQTLAVKKCKVQSEMTEKHKSRWRLEVQIMMQKISHPNVVTAQQIPDCILDVFQEELPLLGMEFCSGGDLRKILQRKENCCGLTEYMVRSITQDVTLGMEYLHSKRIIHRDIKPENVVVQLEDGKTVYKLIDLGYAKDLSEGSICSSFVGTFQYLAPELMAKEKYTSSVDYWSLGIIVFECITGFRPFFHNLQPVKTHNLVIRKADESIWAVMDATETPDFKKKLPQQTQLCRTSRAYFEQFLRLVLQIDAKKRGGGFGENKRPRCFTLLDNILNMKLIHILDVSANQIYSYPAPESHSLEEVQVALEMEVKMPLANQELLLPTGCSPDSKQSVTQCGDAEGEEENIVFLFRRGQTKFVKNERKRVSLPPGVMEMVDDHKVLMEYSKQKQTWAHAIFFCREQAKEYKRLLQAQRALMLNLLRNNSKLSKLKSSMLTNLNSLRAKTEFSRDSLELDLGKYKQQADEGGITSEKMFNHWTKMTSDLDKLESIEEQVKELEESSVALNTKNVELQRSPFSKAKQANEFEKLEIEAADLYEHLKVQHKGCMAELDKAIPVCSDRRPPVANAPMVRIIVKCVTQMQTCLDELYQHLEKLSATKLEVLALIPKIEALLEEIEVATEKLSKNQESRQKDVWKLLGASVKKSKLSTGTSSTSDLGSLARSVSQNSQTQLVSSVFDQQVMYSRYNEASKNQLSQAMSLLASAAASQAPPAGPDWSFLDDASSLLQSLS